MDIARKDRSPYLVGALLGAVVLVPGMFLGFAWADSDEKNQEYCDFYPTVCAQNGGQPPPAPTADYVTWEACQQQGVRPEGGSWAVEWDNGVCEVQQP